MPMRNFVLFFLLIVTASQPLSAASCLYVSSYHLGDAWNDGIEQGLESVLAGHCELQKFYFDAKRNRNRSFQEKKVIQARRIILKQRPDIIIAADDPVSQTLIQPYFKDATVPVVFCGVNHDPARYGYPYSNATGMVELAAVKPLLDTVRRMRPRLKRVIFLAADSDSQEREFSHIRSIFEPEGINIDAEFVDDMEEWKAEFVEAQGADLVLLGGINALERWDAVEALKLVSAASKTLVATNFDYMLPLAMLGVLHVAEEQGVWAGNAVLAVLAGKPIKDIPIATNSRWNTYINPQLLHKIGVEAPLEIQQVAIEITP